MRSVRSLAIFVMLLMFCACMPVDEPTTVTLSWRVTEEESKDGTAQSMLFLLITMNEAERPIYLGTYAGTFTDGRALSVPQPKDVLLEGLFWHDTEANDIVIRRDRRSEITALVRTTKAKAKPGAYRRITTIQISPFADVLPTLPE